MQQKLKDGWQYGETKDDKAKLHPCLVEYEDLPVQQKVKDSLFAGIVNAFAEHLPLTPMMSQVLEPDKT